MPSARASGPPGRSSSSRSAWGSSRTSRRSSPWGCSSGSWRWRASCGSCRGLRGFHYRRELGTRHAVWGDRVPITITLWNRSWLPVAWLTAEDQLSEAIVIRGDTARPVGEDASGRRWLRNAWTLWPFEKVERRFVLEADRRGRIAFGPGAPGGGRSVRRDSRGRRARAARRADHRAALAARPDRCLACPLVGAAASRARLPGGSGALRGRACLPAR